MAEDMIIIHNMIIRIINTVYLQCINVEKSPNDVQDFVSYAIEWAKMVEEHHQTEERDVFPAIEKMAEASGLMEANIAQHEAFTGGLHEYLSYLEKVQKGEGEGEEAYNGMKLKGIIDSFMPGLRQHLSDEIDTLLKLGEYDVEWDEWFEKLMKELLRKSNDPALKVCTNYGLVLLPPGTDVRLDGSHDGLIADNNDPASSHKPRQVVRGRNICVVAGAAVVRYDTVPVVLHPHTQKLVAVFFVR